ncbi:hypothetical protein ACFTUC_14160 [Streptomyces sp. NPDC056944]|uniref:hypothetical protein n=1 Tax=Streptomyces sp. NPDC056944 TaxID=3345972 RepID=UPI0036378AA4
MSASEKSGQDRFPWTGPYAVPDYPDMAEPYDPDAAETYAPTGMEEPSTLPAPLAEKAHAAAQAARGVGSTLWSAVCAHKAVMGGAVVGTAAALTLAYARGRRAGRRGLGPVALLLDRRP